MTQIILRSGDSLTEAEIMEAYLLLARSKASFPLLSQHDTHLACLMLMPDLLEYNDEEGVV